MALPSQVYKAKIFVSDLSRNYYSDHALTVARHPSENEERLIVRLIAFCLNAAPDLAFGRGLSTEDEAALWEVTPGGEILKWIDVGLPEEKPVKKACGRADEVVVYAYGKRKIKPWWSRLEKVFSELPKLRVYEISDDDIAALMPLLERSMDWTAVVDDESSLTVSSGDKTVHLQLARLK
jgi:uncharacterized protein YaeQ